MKKIAIILSIILLLSSLTGCAEYADAWQEGVDRAYAIQEQKAIESGYFELVFQDNDDHLYILRDTLTDVLYMQYHDWAGYGAAGGLTVMLNADGTPLLYAEWLEMCSAKR